MPYHQPDRLMVLAIYNQKLKYATDLSYPDFLDWRRSARSFEQIGAFKPLGFDLASPGMPEHVDGNEVSSSFFGTLGVKLALGRDFLPEDDRTGGMPSVIISNRLWQERFGGNPVALGKTVTMNGDDYTIVGVLKPGFRFMERQADVYTLVGRGDPLYLNDRTVHNILCIGRLRTGVAVDQARAEMNLVQARIDRLNPTTERGLGGYVEPLKQFLAGDVSGTLFLLLGAAGLVLLIACANVANLLLARSVVRTREFAVRLAVGARRSQLVRQLVTESLILSVIGGALGLAVAKWAIQAVLATMQGGLPRAENIGLNVPVFFFALGVSMTVGIAFGVLPALKSSKTDVQAGLKEGGRGTTGGHQRIQRALVVVQIALALVLLTGGSLLFRTIHNLWAVDPGFDTKNVVSLFKWGSRPRRRTRHRKYELHSDNWSSASA